MKVLFVVTELNLGGITTACINFYNLLVEKGHSVNILNMAGAEDKEMSPFDNKVNILYLDKKRQYWNVTMSKARIKKGLFVKLKYFAIGLKKKILTKKGKWLSTIFNNYDLNDQEYDVAIAYRQCAPCYYFVLNNVKAKKKIAFVHGTVEDMGDISSWDHYLYSFDKVAYVSNAVNDGFIRRYPKLDRNATTIYNMLDSHSIIQRAQEECEVCFNKGAINIVTVSRIENSQKGTDRIAPICKRLKESGITNFAWYIVGDGPDFELCKKQAEELGVTDRLFFLGAKTNPYPYLKAADFSVLPTKGESFGLVVVESLILGTPPIVCDYPALKELLQDDFNGIIVPQDGDKLYEAVKKMVKENAFFERIRNNCLSYSYDNEYVYQQFLEAVK